MARKRKWKLKNRRK